LSPAHSATGPLTIVDPLLAEQDRPREAHQEPNGQRTEDVWLHRFTPA